MVTSLILRYTPFLTDPFSILTSVFSVQLLSEEYSVMSPGTLEAQGLINSTEYQKVAALTQSASPDAHKKIAGNIQCRVRNRS
jgi:hypothetical protein